MARVWIALLRAVNLGSRNKVPMAGLREIFEQAGAEDVRTYIQSGNVAFRHEQPEAAALERAIADAFGVRTTVVLRSARQIRGLVRRHPFGPDTSRSHAAFLAAKPSAAGLRAVAELAAGADRFERIGADLALRYPNGFQGAQLTAARIETALGVPLTVRNWRTVERLAELAAEL